MSTTAPFASLIVSEPTEDFAGLAFHCEVASSVPC
jgi:hypothetical protein